MNKTRRDILSLAAGSAAALALPLARAQSPSPIRIGVLNDQSTVYADFQGLGSVLAAQMAVEDYGGEVLGRKIEVVSGDHQNKTDLGSSLARKWYERDGVEVILDVPNSSIALAVSELARNSNKVFIGSGAGTSLLTGEQCSPNTIHWTYDTWALGHSLAKAILQRGGKSWFFITADYAFGHDMEKQASEEVVGGGGKVVGAVRVPLGTADFSSFLLQAQTSGADVVGLAMAGGDLSTSMKQAAEFGLPQKQTMAPMIFGPVNIKALGLEATQGAFLVKPWDWSLDESTRAWGRKYRARSHNDAMPNDMQAGCYSAVLHYLKAADQVGSVEDGAAVVAAMKAMPTDDPLYGQGQIRADGRKIHPMYLFQIKTPGESKEDWDYLKVVATVPGEEAFRPLSEGGCVLVKGA